MNFESPTAIIIDWLTMPEGNNLKAELSKCSEITRCDTEAGKWVVVRCFDDQVLENIVEAQNSFRHRDLYAEGYTEVSLQNNDGVVAYRLPIEGIANENPCKDLNDRDRSLPAIAIVEFDTDLAVKCTWQNGKIGKLGARWAGTNLAAHHYPLELARYKDALQRHQTITNFEYKALDGNLEPIIKVVNAQLFFDAGVLYRCVQTLQHEKI